MALRFSCILLLLVGSLCIIAAYGDYYEDDEALADIGSSDGGLEDEWADELDFATFEKWHSDDIGQGPADLNDDELENEDETDDAAEWAVRRSLDTVTKVETTEKIPGPKSKEDWKVYKLPKVKVGVFTFTVKGTGAEISFKLDKPTATPDQLAWIQVVRTGNRHKWYTTPAEIGILSRENDNFKLRTEGTSGFRVDKTKNENVPFWEQTTIKEGETLTTYAINFDIGFGTIADTTVKGAVMKILDSPDPISGLQRTMERDPTIDMYRFHFFSSVMSVKTGKIYGTVEWCMQLEKSQQLSFCVPKVVADVGHPGQKLAYEKWNNQFAQGYSKLTRQCPGCSKTVYKVPGKAVAW